MKSTSTTSAVSILAKVMMACPPHFCQRAFLTLMQISESCRITQLVGWLEFNGAFNTIQVISE